MEKTKFEQLRDWWTEKGRDKTRFAIGIVLLATVSGISGYYVGEKRCIHSISMGLDKTFKVNPGLRDELYDAIDEVKSSDNL